MATILAIEPYAATSHQVFLAGLQRHSKHRVEIDELPARKWKWRLRTSAFHFAPRVAESGSDLLLVSDFVNLAELRGLAAQAGRCPPALLYFHENQLTYPLPDHQERDYDFTLDHLHSILASEATFFNSEYHRRSFFDELGTIVRLFPDLDGRALARDAEERAKVLPLGSDVAIDDRDFAPRPVPVVVWNHRWEHDKDPDAFLTALRHARSEGLPFRLRVLGPEFRDRPVAFDRLRAEFADDLEAFGEVEDRDAYLELLRGGDILVSTARHEFFGLSSLEAIRCGLLPVLPRDLAYPELLPEGARKHRAILYPRARGAGPALAEAIRIVQRGGIVDLRREIQAYSDRFSWERLIERYDEEFSRYAK